MLSRLIAPQAMIPFAAKILGVKSDALQQFAARAQTDLAAQAGPGFALIPAVMSMMKGEFSGVRGLYKSVLANPVTRPVAAEVVSEWLKANDPDHVALQLMGYVSDLPLKHMGRDFDSVPDFLEQGLFPLLDEVFSNPQCACGADMVRMTEDVAYCASCDKYKDV